MYKLGIIGYPLGHSISAVIQKAGLESIGLGGEYDVMETPPEELINRIKYIKANGYNGFNVTIPLKVPMSLFLEDIDDYANIAGCVNTVKVMEDKSFHGYNTDIYGFKKAIPAEIDLNGKTASILGTGGASRAAVVGLAERGIKNIDFYSHLLKNENRKNIKGNSYTIFNGRMRGQKVICRPVWRPVMPRRRRGAWLLS